MTSDLWRIIPPVHNGNPKHLLWASFTCLHCRMRRENIPTMVKEIRNSFITNTDGKLFYI